MVGDVVLLCLAAARLELHRHVVGGAAAADPTQQVTPRRRR